MGLSPPARRWPQNISVVDQSAGSEGQALRRLRRVSCFRVELPGLGCGFETTLDRPARQEQNTIPRHPLTSSQDPDRPLATGRLMFHPRLQQVGRHAQGSWWSAAPVILICCRPGSLPTRSHSSASVYTRGAAGRHVLRAAS